MHFSHVVVVLIEILVVILCSRLLGSLVHRFGQPLVVGEIAAGILLGPSFLGAIAPKLELAIFPQASGSYLELLAQVGLIFFMFLIGLELNPQYLQGRLRLALWVSNLSVLLPFGLGIGLAIGLQRFYPAILVQGVGLLPVSLFLGVALSITAFPVLARILTERNLQRTPLGSLALTCAAIDDLTAWCLLAIAIAVTRTNSMVAAIPTIILAILFCGGMLTLGRRWLGNVISRWYARSGELSQVLLATIYMGVLVSALLTELIGIHFIFGAFLLGVVLPKNQELTRDLALRTEDFVLTILLPVFFAYSGLRTDLSRLNQPALWFIGVLILVVAIAGKVGGAYLAARWGKLSSREAQTLGWLMNTRGLTELVVLNIGLSLGVISSELFTLLVIMALVTTVMTTPLLNRLYPQRRILSLPQPQLANAESAYQVLVPLANPRTQRELLSVATDLALSDRGMGVIYPTNLLEINNDYGFNDMPVEVEAELQSLQQGMDRLLAGMRFPPTAVLPIIRSSGNVGRDLCQLADQARVDLVLAGWHRSTVGDSRLGGRVGYLLNHAPTDVAIYVNKDSDSSRRHLLVPYGGSSHDDLSLELALRLLLGQPQRQLRLLQFEAIAGAELSAEARALLDQLSPELRDRIRYECLWQQDPLDFLIEATAEADLTLVGTSRSWGLARKTLGFYPDRLVEACHSSLIVTRRYTAMSRHLSPQTLSLATIQSES
ncbi:cation:proton antiporter [Synechococcus elongatus]|uniref:Cation:proton antiporter n=1 Tax=Synechococcus elongatus PCC 11801 TaxID=2219813 RepID=A0AAN1QLD4_SYNEL|nr:cation:proton antiporter [Synechococcus elongatus]AZB71428.1 sodium:proton antiporter [Synechococcus elongatus PCC 11801]